MWWQAILGAVVGYALWLLHDIFVEVRAIRRMMNSDRDIADETTSLDR